MAISGDSRSGQNEAYIRDATKPVAIRGLSSVSMITLEGLYTLKHIG